MRCFYPNQYADIVNRISSEIYCDSISAQQAKIILDQDTLNLFYKKQLSLLQNIIVNDNYIMNNYEATMSAYKLDMAAAKKQAKKYKRQRWLFLAGGLLVGFGIGHF